MVKRQRTTTSQLANRSMHIPCSEICHQHTQLSRIKLQIKAKVSLQSPPLGGESQCPSLRKSLLKYKLFRSAHPDDTVRHIVNYGPKLWPSWLKLRNAQWILVLFLLAHGIRFSDTSLATGDARATMEMRDHSHRTLARALASNIGYIGALICYSSSPSILERSCLLVCFQDWITLCVGWWRSSALEMWVISCDQAGLSPFYR